MRERFLKETWEKPTKIIDSLLLFLPQPPCKVLTSFYAHQVGLGKFLKKNKKQNCPNHFALRQASLRVPEPWWAGWVDLGVSCAGLPHLPMPSIGTCPKHKLQECLLNISSTFQAPCSPPTSTLPTLGHHIISLSHSALQTATVLRFGGKSPRQKPEYNCFRTLPGSVYKLHLRGRVNLL